MIRMSVVAMVLVALLTGQVVIAGTIGPIRADHVVAGTVIGSPPRRVNLVTVNFTDPGHGFLAVQTGECPGKGHAGSLLATTNGGETWQTRHVGITFFILSFVSPSYGFGVDRVGRVLATHDGGRRWSVSPAPAQGASSIDFVDAQRGWLLAGGLFRTVDGGRTWAELPFRCGQNQMIARVSFVDSRTGFLLCRAYNGPFAIPLYRSDDGGTSWRRVSVVDPTAHALGAFDFISPRIGFASAGFGNLLRTIDGGNIFQMVPGTPFEDVQAASWLSPLVGYVSTRGALMETADAGVRWRQVYPAVKPLGPIALTASGAGVGAGTGWFPAAILRTRDGIDWQYVTQLPATSIDRLVRTSTRAVWAVAPVTNDSHVQVRLFRSTNDGQSWQEMLSTRGGTGFLSFAGSRVGFLATTTPFRLYVTLDGGSTWARRRESTQTWNDQFVSEKSGWAFGAGATLLRTDDGGRRWQRVAIGVSGLHPAELYFLNPNDGWISGTQCDFAGSCVPVTLRTRDGGAHWILIRFPLSFGFDGFDWVTPRLGYLQVGSTIYGTRDGGITWRIVRR